MTPYHPYHRNVLLETGYALDHLIWSYRSELDRTPTFAMSADDICLNDFANRTASLVRAVLDEDSRRSGPKLEYKPPSPSDHARRLRVAIEARRRVLAELSKRAPDPVTVPSRGTAFDNEPEEAELPVNEDAAELGRGTARNRRRPR